MLININFNQQNITCLLFNHHDHSRTTVCLLCGDALLYRKQTTSEILPSNRKRLNWFNSN